MAALATTGVRFGLSDATFDQWWASALFPEDADEFVHLRGGNKLSARFVCALDFLTATGQQRPPPDLIVRAYVLARKLPDEMMRDDKTRIDAQYLYADAAVEALLERLRYRDRNAAMERVSKLTLKAVEDHLTKGTETKEAIKAGVTLMAMDQRARDAENNRRDKRAYRDAMNASRSLHYDAAAPPTLEAVKVLMAQLRDQFGPDVLRELMSSAIPIDGGKDTTSQTIENE